MKLTLRAVVTTAVASLAFLAATGSAQAATCSLGDSGYTVNRVGQGAIFRSLQPARGMNCASARYVLNRWLRPAYARSHRRQLPVRFFDNYVTWHCSKLTDLRWVCNEYTSNTSFRFTAIRA